MPIWNGQEEGEELVRGLLELQFPCVAADPARVRFLSEGEDFKVFECGGWAWRFPKRAEVERWMLREGPLLEAIGPALGIPVPRFTFQGKPGNGFPFAFVGYRMLNGTAADRLGGVAGPALATDTARFLSALHSVPVDLALRIGVADCANEFSPETSLARVREACGESAPPGLPARSGAVSPACRYA